MIKLFPSILAAVLGEAFAFLAVLCCVCFAALFAKRFPRLRIFRLPRAALAVLGVLALAAVLVSDKPPAGTNGTNRAGAPARGVGRVMVAGADGVTDADVANGWREVSRSTNALDASVFAVPSDGVVWDEARARGARRGYWRLPLSGWGFPGAGFGWTNGFVWAEGMFRPKVESTRDGLVVLDHGLALAPAANWARYGLDASLFWCRTNAVGGLVGTFLGAAVDDDPVKIVNAQFELFPSNGCVALRYDLSRAGEGVFAAGPFEDGEGRFVQLSTNTSEVVLQRVHPNDWDMDGLPNVLDEDPRVPAVVPTRNQSSDWAARAFPGHAAEIASAGGYLAWAAARGGEADRHLVGLNVESPAGVWPVCLSFGDLQVMCDGTRTLYFPIDDGARYPFALSDGAVLASVEVAGEGTLRGVWQDGYEPYEQHVGGVGLRLDSPRSGWVGRTATVQIAPLVPDHFFPETPRLVSASVTNCHADAYLDCEWRGPSGFSFSNPTSLTTTVEWNGDVPWATNGFDVVTRFAGPYEVTNHYAVTVGTTDVPPLQLSTSGQSQDVYFVNDYVSSVRTERVYRVSFDLQGPRGTRGVLKVSSSGPADVEFYLDADAIQPVPNELTLAVSPNDFFCSTNLYLRFPALGSAVFSADFVMESGRQVSLVKSCREIEPIRRFVTTDRDQSASGRLVNPSCLVYGTNAVLRVAARWGAGPTFEGTNVKWKVISGPGIPRETNGWNMVITPTADSGEVVVEARFNEDAIQPRFRLPIVKPLEYAVNAYIVEPGFCEECEGNDPSARNNSWTEGELRGRLAEANSVFSQYGVCFRLHDIVHVYDRPFDWEMNIETTVETVQGHRAVLSDQAKSLMTLHPSNSCIAVYCVGEVLPQKYKGARTDFGIILPRNSSTNVLAHELGHVLGLKDCYSRTVADELIENGDEPVERGRFKCDGKDWGEETGRGFYPIDDTVETVLESLLMFGVDKGGTDIPSEWVKALREDEVLEERTFQIEVGERYIERKVEKVYLK